MKFALSSKQKNFIQFRASFRLIVLINLLSMCMKISVNETDCEYRLENVSTVYYHHSQLQKYSIAALRKSDKTIFEL